MIFTKVSAGNIAMAAGAGGSTTVAGISFLDSIGTNSVAYGLIGTLTIGFLGYIMQRRQNARIYRIEQDKLKVEQEKLDELERHNRAMEAKY